MGIPIISDIINGVIGKAGDIASEIITDKDKRAELKATLERLKIEEASKAEQRINDRMLAQIDVNKEEAKHGSIFVAGWRPFIGWVCGVGLAYGVLVEPMASWAARVLFKYVGAFPEIDPTILMFTLGGMLGIGTMRTLEKIKGVSSDTISDSPTASRNVQPRGIPIEDLNMGPDGRVHGEVVPLPKVAPWLR